MQFALLNTERVPASPNLKGLCPGCAQPVIAKCGEQRMWHWAHQGKRTCDPWWEKETEWHREWKNKFANECQEIIQYDQSGEKHIADVRTKHGLVIEFQHSYINPEERNKRERFYGNMVWVVDGTRLKRDFTRFSKDFGYHVKSTIQKGYFLVHFPDERFPANWLNSSVPVIFDFQGTAPADPQDPLRNTLWCLIPGRAEGQAVVVGMSRKDFVTIAPTRPILLDTRKIISDFTWLLQEQRRRERVRSERAFLEVAMRRQQRGRGRRSRRWL